MKTGTVKFFYSTKNFGFVKEDDNEGVEYFFHGSTVQGPAVSDGDKVSFETEQSDRGPRAVNVKKADAE